MGPMAGVKMDAVKQVVNSSTVQAGVDAYWCAPAVKRNRPARKL